MIYGREALRRFREESQRTQDCRARDRDLLSKIPPDAPIDDATLTVWNGERFVAWEKWLATAPIAIDEAPKSLRLPASARCVLGDCGGTRIWLVRDGDRWLMFAGGRRAGNRRRDFASPFLEHAIRTAEAWYGMPANGWCVEEIRDEKRHNAEEQH